MPIPKLPPGGLGSAFGVGLFSGPRGVYGGSGGGGGGDGTVEDMLSTVLDVLRLMYEAF